jgi:hypothetical protein
MIRNSSSAWFRICLVIVLTLALVTSEPVADLFV